MKIDTDVEIGPPAHGTADGQATARYRIMVLVMLTLVYIVSYMDRVVGGVAAPAIQAELKLTDSQIGIINGLAFSAPFVVSSFLLGWVADRTNRKKLLFSAMSVWSLATAAFGLGRSFIHLVFARAGLGVGEGGYYGPSVSILLDYFPRHQYGRLFSIYGFGVPIGMALGIAIGAQLIETVGWRYTFLILGGVSLAMAFLVLIFLAEPTRTRIENQPPLLPSLRALAGNSHYMMVCVGISIGAIASLGLTFWLPSMFLRSHSMDLRTFATTFGLIHFIAGIIGSAVGGYLGDYLARRGVAQAYLKVSAAGYLL
ncbi:MAG: hypothetical protein B7X02_02740, partial [Rhodospirillales bacterium 12-54-5]